MKEKEGGSDPSPVPYSAVRELQLELVEKRIEDRIPDTILFLEHEPVITRGRGLQLGGGVSRPRHMPTPLNLPKGLPLVEIERGGDLTYHGPGQLVVYPILKLDGKGWGPDHDVGAYLRKMEGLIIAKLAQLGVRGESKENATGVWVDSGRKKIASLGIAIRKWVTFHGLALNMENDLKPFHSFSPCGFDPEVMTRLSEWAPLSPSWRKEWENYIAQSMLGGASGTSRQDLQIRTLTLEEARGQN